MIQERGHVLNVLKRTKASLERQDAVKLKDLSNQTIHAASINQESESIILAVVIYSLSKIIERTNYQKYPGLKEFLTHVAQHIDKSIVYVQKENKKGFVKEIEYIRKDINKLTGNLKRQIQDVFQRAKINKASRMYEHGISMEKTAKLLGISIWELTEYAGQTGISDVNLNITIPMRQRIKFAMEMFR